MEEVASDEWRVTRMEGPGADTVAVPLPERSDDAGVNLYFRASEREG
jgi:hypothetical protein